MNKWLSCVLVLAGVALGACTQGGQSASTAPPVSGQETPVTATSGPSASGARATVRATPAAPESRPEPRVPQFREVILPAGTALSVRLETPVASDTSRVEDPVRGALARPIVVDGVTIVPEGAAVGGSVTEAVRSGKVKGRASIAIRFNTLTARDERYDIRTARIARSAASSKKDDATKVGIGAGAGALIGAIAGGGKGAAIGGAVGAGAGTGVVVATRGDEVGLPAGATVSTTLQGPITVLVPLD